MQRRGYVCTSCVFMVKVDGNAVTFVVVSTNVVVVMGAEIAVKIINNAVAVASVSLRTRVLPSVYL